LCYTRTCFTSSFAVFLCKTPFGYTATLQRIPHFVLLRKTAKYFVKLARFSKIFTKIFGVFTTLATLTRTDVREAAYKEVKIQKAK